ncbi:hypothetical protein LguiA_011072 [Lonicera macranthoides]
MAKIQDGNYISRKVNFEDKRLDEEFDAPDNFVIRFSPRDHSSEPILHMTLCDQWTNDVKEAEIWRLMLILQLGIWNEDHKTKSSFTSSSTLAAHRTSTKDTKVSG